jgi:hypothetical protein
MRGSPSASPEASPFEHLDARAEKQMRLPCGQSGNSKETEVSQRRPPSVQKIGDLPGPPLQD